MIFTGGFARRAASGLYGRAVDAARAPEFYRGYGVADTIEGRYEMIVLHIVLLLFRLRSSDQGRGPDRARDSGKGRARLAQALVDFMAADLDRSIRELGVGDLSVSRFMKRLGEGLYGRAAAYESALRSDASALSAALLRNIYDGADPGQGILARLVDYVQTQQRHLADQPMAEIGIGHVDFLAPGGPES